MGQDGAVEPGVELPQLVVRHDGVVVLLQVGVAVRPRGQAWGHDVIYTSIQRSAEATNNLFVRPPYTNSNKKNIEIELKKNTYKQIQTY